ncbi:hypothetical protein DLAC_03841 [Tieghemostelium lacteum]|uniref:Uncharacterized protein n=1 Tax=Tieghemostelium lacteum TaxID=361077 RepID=A0A152A0U7_TIELA|nr:hypothetical protein DLAC_03841 [Tieghemostelium lacteum]|eukprot:KYQ99882.1 hypothetical protein DLAC_03841 [Tieghemostelium lacteum]
MKVNYEYDDCEGEYHTGVTIILGHNDINPDMPSMKSNYNKLGASILRGASENHQRYIYIKNIQGNNLAFARALLLKAYEIAKEREVPISMSFFDGNNNPILSLKEEWGKLQPEIDKFYVNPNENFFLYGSDYDSDD